MKGNLHFQERNGASNKLLQLGDVPDSRGTLTPDVPKGALIIKQLHNTILHYTI